MSPANDAESEARIMRDTGIDKRLVFFCECGTGLRQRLSLVNPVLESCASCGRSLEFVVPVVVDAMLDTLEIMAQAGHKEAQKRLKEAETL